MGELTFLALRGAMIAAPRGWMKIGVKTVRSAVKSVRSVVKCVGWQMVLRSKEVMKKQTSVWSDAWLMDVGSV
jgi:hypothetical protein